MEDLLTAETATTGLRDLACLDALRELRRRRDGPYPLEDVAVLAGITPKPRSFALTQLIAAGLVDQSEETWKMPPDTLPPA